MIEKQSKFKKLLSFLLRHKRLFFELILILYCYFKVTHPFVINGNIGEDFKYVAAKWNSKENELVFSGVLKAEDFAKGYLVYKSFKVGKNLYGKMTCKMTEIWIDKKDNWLNVEPEDLVDGCEVISFNPSDKTAQLHETVYTYNVVGENVSWRNSGVVGIIDSISNYYNFRLFRLH